MSEICLRDSILAEWLSKQDKCYKNYMKLVLLMQELLNQDTK